VGRTLLPSMENQLSAVLATAGEEKTIIKTLSFSVRCIRFSPTGFSL
jgi:hypothetical protein